MSAGLQKLIDVLDLEQIEVNIFRGLSPQDGWQRVFGGQVICQALVAAARTADNVPIHSLHGYFMLPGDPKVPILYEVDRIRDGRSFKTRRVVAIQHGAAIFSMSVSFHKHEEGFQHQIEMPDVPMPEDLPDETSLKEKYIDQAPDYMKAYWKSERAIEMRPTDVRRYIAPSPGEPVQHIWMRTHGTLPDDPAIHQCALAYASDFTLLGTALIPHGRIGFDPNILMASLDHSLWFHRDFRADEWLLYSQDSPSSHFGRGLSRGSVFTRDGILVASVAQEGVIRQRRET